MSFKLESEMLRPVERWLKNQGLHTKAEFANPWGVCDIVGCSLRPQKVKDRLSLGQRRAIGPPFRIQLLERIPDEKTGRSVSPHKLTAEYSCFIRAAEIQKEVETLIAGKFVRRTVRGNLQKINGWAPLHDKIVAVELKLSRIDDVIEQALANQQLTPLSYVALPRETAERTLEKAGGNRILKSGLGLLGVARSGCVELLRASRSPRNIVDNISQAHCVERFWRCYIKSI